MVHFIGTSQQTDVTVHKSKVDCKRKHLVQLKCVEEGDIGSVPGKSFAGTPHGDFAFFGVAP